MIALLSRRPSSRAAADVLRQVFGRAAASFAFRLWDGSEVRFGPASPAFTVAIKSPETFSRLLRDPSPYAFAEAYVESAIDVEGDLFAAMPVADAIEDLDLSLPRRLGILMRLWRR